MSQKVTRKVAVNEEKEKRTDSPVKEMKKKMAANAEKEKQAAEKSTEKTDKAEKNAEKSTEKSTDKPDDKKVDKSAEKKPEKSGEKKPDKSGQKQDKTVDKKPDKSEEKKPETPVEKKDDSKGEKSGKTDKRPDPKDHPKQNGTQPHNVTDATPNTNGVTDAMLNATVKVTRTPETPRPASEKQTEPTDDSKESKSLKPKEDTPVTDRKLRSSDSPKPQDKRDKPQEKTQEPGKKQDLETPEEGKTEVTQQTKDDSESKDRSEKSEKIAVEVVVEVEVADDEARKPDTNYSKSRVKVSPYRRSMRIADQTNTSLLANYTGNNTTMEMDITESSLAEESPALDDSAYLRGLRSIRGRSSYKQLKEITLKHVAAKHARASAANINEPSRPTGTVVGRKRRPDAEDIESGVEAREARETREGDSVGGLWHGKRARLLDRLTLPFRTVTSSLHPLHPPSRAAEIVGINTDLPLTAPVSSSDIFDPETLKPGLSVAPPTPPADVPETDRDGKRCIVM